ncbi:hypothetical protein PMAYCL1PPCAC_28326, partial [Pristionchus mayeri]
RDSSTSAPTVPRLASMNSFECPSQESEYRTEMVSNKYQRMYIIIRFLHEYLQESSQQTVDSTESIDYALPDLPPYLLISSSSLLNLFVRCPSCGDPSINSISFSTHGSVVVLKRRGIDLSIDGRYSRPGFTALNGTISFID